MAQGLGHAAEASLAADMLVGCKAAWGVQGMGTLSLLVCILPQQKNLHLHNSEGHRKYLKLMEKIPEDAEATVVLVGRTCGDSQGQKRPVQMLV